MTNEHLTTGWIKLFHPDVPGAPCSLPLPAMMADGAAVDAGAAFEAVRSYLRAGFLTGDPSLQPGQVRERISQIVRRVKINDDDSETPLIDLYAENAKLIHKKFSRYLNTTDEVREFEAATGITLAKTPLYNSKTAPSREDREFAKFAVTLPAPVEIILAPNPYYEEGKMKPQHVWVSFAGAPQSAPAPEPPAPAGTPFTKEAASEFEVKAAFAGVGRAEALEKVLKVSTYGQFTGTYEDAVARLDEYLKGGKK